MLMLMLGIEAMEAFYKASMPRRPIAPATPAPKAAVGRDAAPVDPEPEPEALAEVLEGRWEFAPPVEARVAEETVLAPVELPVLGLPVAVITTEPLLKTVVLAATEELEAADEAGVVEAAFVAGYSLGR